MKSAPEKFEPKKLLKPNEFAPEKFEPEKFLKPKGTTN